MAKQKGPHKIEGFLDGKIYYRMGNEWYVRNSSAPSKRKLKKGDAYKSFRNNSKEFGVASHIGACFKKSLGSVLENVSDSNVTKRISGLFTKLIHRGHGERGKRSIDVLPNKDLFNGFQFKEEFNFDYNFTAPYSLNVKKNRKDVVLTVPAFKPSTGISKVAGATHFRFVLCLLSFSDYEFDGKSKEYLPVEPSVNKICVSEYSELMPMGRNMVELSLKAQLHIREALKKTVGVVVCLGIEFFQMAAGKPYILERNSCMKIAEVF